MPRIRRTWTRASSVRTSSPHARAIAAPAIPNGGISSTFSTRFTPSAVLWLTRLSPLRPAISSITSRAPVAVATSIAIARITVTTSPVPRYPAPKEPT